MKIDRTFLRNLILYGIIGTISAGFDALVFYLLFDKLAINKFVANVISVHFGIFLSFFLNSFYNFKKTDKMGKRFFSFYLTGLFGLGLSTLILYAGGRLRIDVMATKVFSVVFVALVQFIINRAVAFGDK